MLSWVVKVVPQPPEPPPKTDEKEQKAAAAPAQEKKVTFQDQCRTEATKAVKAGQEAQVALENSPVASSQPGVLTWISGALPHPAVSPKPSRDNSTTTEENAATSKPEDEKGMIAWITEGLEKVVPQPDLKSKEPAEPHTEACHKDAAPEPQVTVVEVESDQEDADNKPFPPRMMDWIKQGIEKVVPQPEIHVRAKQDEKTEAPAAAKAHPPPPPAPTPAADTDKSSKEAEQQPKMMGWIVTEISRMLPQPAQKQDAGSDEVQNRGNCSTSPLK